MQDKVLYVDYEKCTGCRECEVACSIFNTGTSDPSLSRIKVLKWEWDRMYLPMTCQNCENPFCVEVCPTKACHFDEKLCRVVIEKKICIGCKTCIIACPFGAPFLDYSLGISVKCDYCDGDPQCVKACRYDAVRYIDASYVSQVRQEAAADRIKDIIPRQVILENFLANPQ
ncbi:MAG: 4Fe-4S dicluster domain-containing protein [Dehalococcoidales bacterium]|nr:4Fe-4S dicluster domain-containing protein [Dehalococcoidales bacterium]